VAPALHTLMAMHAPAILLHAASHLGGPRVLALPLLRALAIVLGVLWVLLTPAGDPGRSPVGITLLGFTVYSAIVIAALWARPAAVVRRSSVVLLGDVAFALALIALSGGAGSTLFLALPVLAGLPSYYHGIRRGLLVGVAVAMAYVVVCWPTLEGEVANVVVRLATLLGVTAGVGILADANGLPSITGDPNALQQVLVNLLTNARDAIAGGGTIEVRTETSADKLPVRLSVRDTGRGIPGEALPRLFEPFFTTKADGTGLGLAISYGIVRDHHGTIEVDSRSDHGTTFTVTLPAAAWADERA
jgi:hypothetical protein